MIEPTSVKAYGNLWPVSEVEFAVLTDIATLAIPEPGEPTICLEGDLLVISFEGIYFPTEEIIEAIRAHLKSDQQGKLDFYDLDNWRLKRFLFENGTISEHTGRLNDILAWSGH